MFPMHKLPWLRSSGFILVPFTVLALGAACAHEPSRVQLSSPPSAAAPIQARSAFYEAHGPARVQASTSSMDSKWLGPLPILVLRDGRVVEHSADLLETVNPESETAHFATEAVEAGQAARLWRIGATATVATGLVVMLGGMLVPMAIPPASTNIAAEPVSIASLAMMGGGGIVAMSALVPASIALGQTKESLKAHEDAFHAYDKSLREHLAVGAFAQVEERQSAGALASAQE